MGPDFSKQARKLQATLVRNYDPANHLLTGVRCRATSVAKNWETFGGLKDLTDLTLADDDTNSLS